jgi:hypothetical protein
MKHCIYLIFVLSVFSSKGQKSAFSTSGRFILGTHKERTASIGIGDIDLDGDTDIVVANGRHWPGQNRIFINNGRGIFTVSRNLGNEQETSYSTELADFDGDGDLDIAVGNDMAPNFIFINDGSGTLYKRSFFRQKIRPHPKHRGCRY